MRLITLLFIFLLSSPFSFAQSPGGVSGNLRGWFDASTGVTLTGGAVSAWTDRSAIGNASQTTAGERPLQTTSAINYNTALTFDGTNDNLDLADRMASASTGVSAYAVARQTNTTRDSWGSVLNGQANGPLWTGGGYGLVALNVGSTNHGFYTRDYNTKGVSFAVTNGTTTLMSGTWNGTTASRVEAFKNGSSAGTVAYAPGSVGDAGSTWIGSGDGSAGNWCFYGDIAEVIVYDIGNSSINNNKIMSYLAVKYGITLGINYTSASGTTIYAPAASYNNNIIGIGREDASGLTQKQSKNENDSVRVYISTLAASNSANGGSFASNVSFIMMGANTGKLSAIRTEKPASIFSRLEREWQITNTNFGSTFNVDIKLNSIAALASVSTSDLRLLVDDDGNFSNATVYSSADGLTFSYSNPLVTISGINTTMIPSGTTKYITLASIAATTPLPVELLNFAGQSCEKSVCLTWQTASEKNNDYFDVERSSDGINFELLRTVDSKSQNGNSIQPLTYQITDSNPTNGINYYRLKQVDFSKENNYSNTIYITPYTAKNISFSIFPNPNNGDFSIGIEGSSNNYIVDISVYDYCGKLVYSNKTDVESLKNQPYSIALKPTLGAGLYHVLISMDGVYYNNRLIIQ